MIQILKYLLFLVLGIIIFIVYNSVDNFSVGVPAWFDRLLCASAAPVFCTAVDTPYAGCTVPVCTDVDTPYAGCTVPVCTDVDTPYAGCIYTAGGGTVEQDVYLITGNEIVRLLSGYNGENNIFLTDEEFTLVWNLLQKCTDEEGEKVASILRSDNKDNFLRDLSKSPNLVYLYDTPEETSVRYQGLINYYSNSSITLEYLVDVGIESTQITTSGDFTLFRLTTYDSALFDINIGNIRNFNVRSGNSRQHFGLPDDTDYTTYVLGETRDNLIRARINYNPATNYLAEFTAFPVGHGYGAIFLKMLYKSSEHVLIRSFEVDTPENSWAYRSLFRLSVTPISIDANGFVEGDEFYFTIFRPNRRLMILIYPRYNDLITHINPSNDKFNLFLMSLNKDILKENLIDNYNPDILEELYDAFPD